ncbi:MAG: DNA polymerase III subunit delta' C-terminal domain-containing protein [Neofamilia sp.]
MKFEKIIGHDDVVNDLRNMVENENINHAILFEGIGGIGKKYTAELFAKSILCEGDRVNCDSCRKCVQFSSNSNPDYLFITSDNGTIKKEQISELINFLAIRPFDSKYKVVIVEHFHTATIDAQNALLKTLEEGPVYGKIILLSENSRSILETVLSRVKLYRFNPIPKLTLINYLVENFDINENEAVFYADFSNGSIGKSIKIIEDEHFKITRKSILELFDRALKGQSDFVISNINIINEQENLDEILDIYLTWLRDLLVLKDTGKVKYLINRDMERLLFSETHLSKKTINNIKNNIVELKENLKYNISKDLALELFFIDVLEECECKKQSV